MSESPDLSTLNPAERRILTLLAEGHTAKSIAAEIGRTEAAVNERLREARRKTGVGSSRELARLLRAKEHARESRDDLIGIDAEPLATTSILPSAGRSRRRRMEVLVMLVILAALGALAWQLSAPPQESVASSAADPAIDAVLGPVGESPAAQRQRFLGETRDDGWASRTEARLRTAYDAVSGLSDLRVACARSLCQVTAHGPFDDERAQKRTMDELQSPALTSPLVASGLTIASQSFGTAPGTARLLFIGYWRRDR